MMNKHIQAYNTVKAPKNKSRILVVNDDPMQLRMLEQILSKNGNEVVSCRGGKEALEQLNRIQSVDLFIVDLYMPEINGWKLCRLLRSPEFSEYNTIPVLIMSATFSGSDTEDIARELGVNGFLSIPYNQQDLLVTVESILSGEAKGKKLRVLIVEDDENLRRNISEGLNGYGFSVSEAGNGEQANQLFKEVNPDIIILDFHLPDNDGENLLPTFKTPENQASVIVMTGTLDSVVYFSVRRLTNCISSP